MDLVGTLTVKDGRGTLAVRRGPSGSALLVDGRPAVVTWNDPTDPDHAWFVRAHDLAGVELAVGDLDLERGTLVEALRPILERLVDGRYTVHLSDTPDVVRDARRTPDGPPTTGRLVDWAGVHGVQADERVLVGTVPRDLVGEPRVRGLVKAIRAGARPAVVALAAGEHDVACVVAGHAALEAWRRLGAPPLLVRLDAVDAAALDDVATEGLLAAACAHVADIVRAHWRAVRPAAAAG